MHRQCVAGPLFGPGDEARYAAASMVTDALTHTHRMTTVTLTHAPRVNYNTYMAQNLKAVLLLSSD